MLVFFGWKQKAILAESGQSARLQVVLELGVRKVLQPGHSVQQHVPTFPVFLQQPPVTVETREGELDRLEARVCWYRFAKSSARRP